MTLSRSDWKAYIDRLAQINERAGALMQQYLDANGYEDTQRLIAYAYALATKYGGAASSLACEMYDALALAQGAVLPAAEPAETAAFGEVAKAVRGTMKNGRNSVPDTVSRLVKQAGADTTVKNALRDGAEWAWIPSGDTCAFCLTLASRGWQKASKKTLRGDHAEHIHAHCNCEFAIRFDGKSTVAGYDPEAYREAYDHAEGSTPKEKINALRRDWYAGNKEKINQQKRAAYAERQNKKKIIEPPKRKGVSAKEENPIDVTEEYFSLARPGFGKLIIEDQEHADVHSDEIYIADMIHRTFGGDIIVRREIPGVENADYLWRELLWELKTPISENNLNKLIQKGLSQIFQSPGGIVVDRTKLKTEISRVEQIIKGRMNTSQKKTCDIMIVKAGTVEKVLRYKK